MIRYAARAVPWSLLGVGCALIAGLMTLVGAWPWVMWPLQGTAVGLVAGIVAWSADERCAAIVDTLPRSLAWRTVARSIAAPVVLTVWLVCLLVTRPQLPPHLSLFAGQGITAACAATAVTAWRRSRGAPEPGHAFASIAIPSAAAFALARPFPRVVVLFPVWPGDNWRLSATIWVGAGSVSLAVLAYLTVCQRSTQPPTPLLPARRDRMLTGRSPLPAQRGS